MYPDLAQARSLPVGDGASLPGALAQRVVVVGLGYVGLPLAVALAGRFETVGLDIDARRIAELDGGHDRTGEIDRDRLEASTLALTADPGCALRRISTS
jgi:UDP-N-acetyl-D-galactosamine dehydrogenase